MAARLALHEGQSPRQGHEKATWNSALQTGHRTMAKPDSKNPAVEVGGHGAIPATLPKSVLAFESLFPYGLDGFVVGFEELE